jgi:hypothetical protein
LQNRNKISCVQARDVCKYAKAAEVGEGNEGGIQTVIRPFANQNKNLGNNRDRRPDEDTSANNNPNDLCIREKG